jgi:hypothetical protein
LHLHIHREVPLILGRVPAPPAIALLVRLGSAFEEFAQIIAALHRIGGPDLLAPAMMGLVHADNHGRRVGQCQMIDEAAEDMSAASRPDMTNSSPTSWASSNAPLSPFRSDS